MHKITCFSASIIMLALSACSSLSIGTKVGDIRVDGKSEQPSVIVNSDEKSAIKALNIHR
ncbi:hypothetical protein [Cognaticolwellia mytili]|uniref:hypothetical protein n=1 Tax=Cognaticolwellia mytili TaxID=1888913 RepID=UPI00117F2BF8|nr:hypothetical protein [Cognaticolwellia mytili]